eukprot:Skav231304  [mRNA]  locus=scaffold161:318148:318732:- [translate_table: standard]
MSQGSSNDPGIGDNITLTVDFEGLVVTVPGPSESALDFVRRLPGLRGEASASSQDGGYQESSVAPSGEAAAPFEPLPCPAGLFALGKELRSAKYTAKDRINRAWEAGQFARAFCNERISKVPQISSLRELPSKVYVVLRSQKHQRPFVYYNTTDLRASLGDCTSKTIFQGFPSRVEARIYCQSFGEGIPEELLV